MREPTDGTDDATPKRSEMTRAVVNATLAADNILAAVHALEVATMKPHSLWVAAVSDYERTLKRCIPVLQRALESVKNT